MTPIPVDVSTRLAVWPLHSHSWDQWRTAAITWRPSVPRGSALFVLESAIAEEEPSRVAAHDMRLGERYCWRAEATEADVEAATVVGVRLDSRALQLSLAADPMVTTLCTLSAPPPPRPAAAAAADAAAAASDSVAPALDSLSAHGAAPPPPAESPYVEIVFPDASRKLGTRRGSKSLEQRPSKSGFGSILEMSPDCVRLYQGRRACL